MKALVFNEEVVSLDYQAEHLYDLILSQLEPGHQFLPIIDTPLFFDDNTQYLVHDGYTVDNGHVLKNYQVFNYTLEQKEAEILPRLMALYDQTALALGFVTGAAGAMANINSNLQQIASKSMAFITWTDNVSLYLTNIKTQIVLGQIAMPSVDALLQDIVLNNPPPE
jgi:hypothetical protein